MLVRVSARWSGEQLTAPQQEEYAEPFKRINVEQAKELIDGGKVSVIDVREDWEYASGHIPNAKHVPLGRIINAAQQHVEGDNLVFVCEVGQRSAVAAEFAAALGRENLYNLEGGTTAWRKAGYPVEK
jgi:sulfur-carrier protein adenylyltransferase/sulfurtransferase